LVISARCNNKKIEDLKRAAATTSLPLFRAALKWNTTNRIKAVALDVFNKTFPQSIYKEELVSRLVTHIMSCCPVLPTDVNDDVADIAIAHTPNARFKENEVLFLEQNGMSNFGEPCVVASDLLSGWVVRDGEFFKLGIIPQKDIHWGKLVEKKKEVSICEN